MRALYFSGWLVVCFVLESTVLHWLSPDYWGGRYIISPHATVVLTVMLAVGLGPYKGLGLGILVGFVHDLVFGYMLGPVSFSLGVAGYLSGMIGRLFHGGGLLLILAAFFGDLIYQLILYGIYQLFDWHLAGLMWSLLHQMIPTAAGNLVVATVLYFFMRKFLLQWSQKLVSEEASA